MVSINLNWLLIIFVLFASRLGYGLPAPPLSTLSTSSFLGQSLGRSCFAFDLPADVLPCNSAFIAKNRKGRFASNLSFGNNISYFEEASDLSKGKSDQDSIRTLFSKRGQDDLFAKFELGYLSETFGVSLTPLQVQYFSVFENPALPEIDLYVASEQGLRLQIGSYFFGEWSWGVQLRYVQRKFVSQKFFLTDALVSGGADELFRPKEQNLFILEPALLFAPLENDWNPETTFSVQNLGFASKTYESAPLKPEIHFTSSLTREFLSGRWGLGVDLFWSETVKSALDPLSLGTFYEFSLVRLLGSLSKWDQSLGVQFFVGGWNIGFTHAWRIGDNDNYFRRESRRTYLFFGVEI